MSTKAFVARYALAAFLPLAFVLGVAAANANSYDFRPTNSNYNQSTGACSIGYGCR